MNLDSSAKLRQAIKRILEAYSQSSASERTTVRREDLAVLLAAITACRIEQPHIHPHQN